MTDPDDPTMPLPTADEASLAPDVAPHMPIADARTAELTAFARRAPASRIPGAVLGLVGGLAAATALGAVLLVTLGSPSLPRPVTTSTPVPAPAATVPVDEDEDDGEEPAAPPPPVSEPEPTSAPTEPPAPTDPPTPAPTP